MSLDLISDYHQLAVNKLLSQFDNKINIQDLLEVLTGPLQELENFFYDLNTGLTIPLASGVLLDLFGSMVARDRAGFSDALYRTLIYIKIGENNSRGNIEPFHTLIQTLTGATLIIVDEEFPAGVTITLDTLGIDPSLLPLLDRILSAGVGSSIRLVGVGEQPFAFEGPTGSGFGSTADSEVGGRFVQRILLTPNLLTTPSFIFAFKGPQGLGLGSTFSDVGGQFRQQI